MPLEIQTSRTDEGMTEHDSNELRAETQAMREPGTVVPRFIIHKPEHTTEESGTSNRYLFCGVIAQVIPVLTSNFQFPSVKSTPRGHIELEIHSPTCISVEICYIGTYHDNLTGLPTQEVHGSAGLGFIHLGKAHHSDSIEPSAIRNEPVLELTPNQIAFVRNALQTCLSNPLHDCNPKLDPGLPEQWPKRILAITELIRLIDFNSQKLPGEYAALSYCWGEQDELDRHPPLKATSPTLSDLKAGVSFLRLPLTLHQAVRVCQYLGIKHIWIDCLCIIQDSKDGLDWEEEARKMQTVYSMAKIVIIASSSTSCHSGFFNIEVPGSVPLMDGQLQLRPSNCAGFHMGSGKIYNDHLTSRGRPYQEEALASRYVKFTTTDIQW
ncbi:heterokaryon incompatibility protein-domain-containing protein [Podospora fimiseda]|uniref:Heterokaryon incompatibility protein-domain-containing protein n=1 Tax=Podospora fimiseda TaxID=252190 RepID=A0AAN6YNZ1_9PEZI|nr:heterokaryon incompatibility protein-domain-containing protein [Podospora fimiseda]